MEILKPLALDLWSDAIALHRPSLVAGGSLHRRIVGKHAAFILRCAEGRAIVLWARCGQYNRPETESKNKNAHKPSDNDQPSRCGAFCRARHYDLPKNRWRPTTIKVALIFISFMGLLYEIRRPMRPVTIGRSSSPVRRLFHIRYCQRILAGRPEPLQLGQSPRRLTAAHLPGSMHRLPIEQLRQA